MSRTATIAELAAWARQLSDTENDPNITDAELLALASRHVGEVWDRLVDAGPPDYYAADATITTTVDQISYTPSLSGNSMRNLLALYVRESTHERRKLPPMPEGARGSYRAPSGVWTLDLEYIPAPPKITGASLAAASPGTFDGISGWEELIACLMARDVMIKREADISAVLNNISRLEARITARSRSRDRGASKRVTDLDDARSPYPWGWSGSSRLACYRLRAGNIELFEPLWGVSP